MSVYKEFRVDGWPYCPQCEEAESRPSSVTSLRP